MRILALVVLASLVACGDSSSSKSDGATPDGGATPDSGTLVDAAPADATTNLGFVTLMSYSAPAHTRASATFLVGGPAFTCSEQVNGPCTLYRCTPRAGANSSPAPSAGIIRVTGTSQPLTFTPASDGFYDVIVLTSSVWAGGETLTAAAAGAVVPAFSGTVQAPRKITLTAPSVPAGDWTIPRGQPLALTWTGGTGESVVVTFGANTTNPLELECIFPASAGGGTVPAAGLALLPAGDGYYSAVTRMKTDLPLGSWQVTLRADTDALLPSAATVVGSAVFQ